MTIKEERDLHFHSIEKGCIIKATRIEAVDKFKSMRSCYCKTHDKDHCYCGWEWGWHYGNDSKALRHNELQNNLDDKIRTKKICNITKIQEDLEKEHLQTMF